MEICSVGAELFLADRRDEANSRFQQFCERAKTGPPPPPPAHTQPIQNLTRTN
jgi:hypothetical protein